ncbi:D-isomer specific 2-hydroxyacid dehydrogenase family protein [Haloactinomyces albus]|uniref:D-3-phosphoglycerate dehydrogenase n=1 Tax=Haloactinomyces albus TaxID=1352928 RepID=A0AAE3ZBI7_9ACTN|nr:D-isomer specific 2-hydroxyacid dehydrogenase family protein [Haloactinomyces albus]MDR7300683.1 D-3-phosphoglycerate dehydrogenase [Haloactinomyces albus]
MKIHVGPVRAPELEEAVLDAGGELSTLREASALVWYGAGPERFGDFHHSGIEWVQIPSAGIEPWLAAGALGGDETLFTSAAGAYAETVAEHALALMLAGTRQLHTIARAGSWQRPEGIRTLLGATVGIIGAGGIGRSLIRLLEPFGVRVLAVNRSGRQVAGAQRTIRADDSEGIGELLGACDHVVIAAPATTSTDKLIAATELERMQPHAWLVNIARGSLVDTEALVAALAEGRIAGAALDVTDPEPLPDGHPLFGEPRALISPHSANPQHLLLPALARRVHTNVARYLAGEPLEGVVDLSAGY